MSKGILYVGAVAACLASTPAMAQISVDFYPPAAFVATSRPVYYQGRPTYWYGNRWYYRDGRNWHSYRDEPRALHNYRGQHEPYRQFYGRTHAGGFRR
jgi:hypothetical protein